MSSPAVILSGTLQSIAGSSNTGTVQISLVNYGDNPPLVSGSALMVPVSVTVQAASDGTWSTSLWGNDQLSPKNTFYQVQTIPAGANIPAWAASYIFNSGSYDLSTQTPVSTIPQPVPPYVVTGLIAQSAPSGEFFNGINTNGTFSYTQSSTPGVVLTSTQAGTDLFAQIANALAGLPATGGTIDARGYSITQTITSGSLTISTSNVTILLPSVNIAMGSNQIIVLPGTMNVRLVGAVPYGGQWSSATSGGTFISYTGNSSAIEVGSSSANTIGFQMKDVYVNITGAGSSAIGLGLLRCPQYRLDGCYFNALLTDCSQEGLRLDGTGNYTGGTIFECNFNGGQYCLHMTGTGSAIAAANTLVGCHFTGASGVFSNPTSAIYFEKAGQNFVFGGDAEGFDIGHHFGGSATSNQLTARYEANTVDYQLDSGASYNMILTPNYSINAVDNSGNKENVQFDTYHIRLQPHWFEQFTVDENPTTWQVANGLTTAQDFIFNINQKNAHSWTLTADTNQGFSILRDWGTAVGGIEFSGSNGEIILNGWGTGALLINASTNSGTGGVGFYSGGSSPAKVAGIDDSGNISGNSLAVSGNQPTVASGSIGLGSNVQTTVGAAGAASALPATPSGYMLINVGGTNYAVPYFKAS